jgi:hypothetical protein
MSRAVFLLSLPGGAVTRRAALYVLLALLALLNVGCDDCGKSPTGDQILGCSAYQGNNGAGVEVCQGPHCFQSFDGDAGVVIAVVDGGCSVDADAGGCASCVQAACCSEAAACPADAGADCAALDQCVSENCSTQCPGVP